MPRKELRRVGAWRIALLTSKREKLYKNQVQGVEFAKESFYRYGARDDWGNPSEGSAKKTRISWSPLVKSMGQPPGREHTCQD